MSSNTMHIKRVTLTSKKNWWMVELDDDEEHQNKQPTSAPEDASPNEPHRTPYSHYRTPRSYDSSHRTPRAYDSTTHASTSSTLQVPVYTPPNHPTSLFSFPTPTSYSAPPNPTQNLAPCAAGSASELFKCIVKKPNVVQLEINGEMSSNARDVTTQFLAELRVYTTLPRHRNVAAFLGCLENVGMVLEFIDGRTLFDALRATPPLTRAKKLDFHNQLLDGLTHLHAFGLSHGDLSLLNVQVTWSSDTIKLLDFGRSVAADSAYASPLHDPDEPPPPPPRAPPVISRFGTPHTTEPRPVLTPVQTQRKIERIHPGTRPFSAPEVLRAECQDALLADAYSFGMILVCLDRCALVDVKPWDQRKDRLPSGFLDGLEVFGERCAEYLRRFDQGRRRLVKEDMIQVGEPMDLSD